MNDEELPAYTAPSADYGITVDASLSAMNARTKEEYDERMQRHFDACHEAGRQFAYRQEQRILNALLGTPVVVKELTMEERERLTQLAADQTGELRVSPISSEQYYQATEDIKAGEWVTLADDGGVVRCPNQGELQDAYMQATRRKKLEDAVPADVA